jgi:uncharacterized protein
MSSFAQTLPEQPLSDKEYDRLEAILSRLPEKDSMNLEEMDGFFAALICGPTAVAPTECLDEIWGAGVGSFIDHADFDEFLNLAMRHWNFIAHTLAFPESVFHPYLSLEEGQTLPNGNRWAKGFLRGMNLCLDEWNPLLQNENHFAMLIPILALAHENDLDPEMRSWATRPDSELRERVLVGLSVSTRLLYDHFRAYPQTKVRNRSSSSRKKIGRNDPCYCGSGQKYKHCCGNVTLQ